MVKYLENEECFYKRKVTQYCFAALFHQRIILYMRDCFKCDLNAVELNLGN